MLLAAVCVILCLSGCGKLKSMIPETLILTTGFEENELFRLDQVSCYKGEAFLYLSGMEQEFSKVYGDSAGEITFQDKTFDERMREEALSRLSRVKAMQMLAEEKGIALDEEETALCDEAAGEYLSALPNAAKEMLGEDTGLVNTAFREYALADKLYRELSLNTDPEISDDEARVILLEQILIKTYTEDEDGKRQTVSDSEKDALKIMADEIRREAVSGEQSFEALMAMYNEAREGSISMSALEAPKEVLSLSRDEISEVSESEEGFSIYRCIAPVSEQGTQENKERIIAMRRQESFSEEYDDFVSGLNLYFNDGVWEEIEEADLSHFTEDFFSVYAEHFKNR